jgi:hypothetical protein
MSNKHTISHTASTKSLFPYNKQDVCPAIVESKRVSRARYKDFPNHKHFVSFDFDISTFNGEEPTAYITNLKKY